MTNETDELYTWTMARIWLRQLEPKGDARGAISRAHTHLKWAPSCIIVWDDRLLAMMIIIIITVGH